MRTPPLTPLAPQASPSSLYERFAAASALDPARPLVEEPAAGLRLTGPELAARIEAVAARLRGAGLRNGAPALLAGLEGADFLVALLAVWRCDAAAVAAGARLSTAEAARLEECFRPGVVVTAGATGEPAIRAGDAGAASPLPPDIAVVKVTSGSTGRPRGIAVTAAQQAADGRQILEGMRLDPADINLAAIPMSHSYGLGSLVMPLVLAGIPLRLLDAATPARLAEGLSCREAAVFPAVPYLFALLSRDGGPTIERRGLRLCLSAGAPLAPSIAEAFRRRHGLPVRAFYGTSETGGIAFDASPGGRAAEDQDGGVGRPLPGVSVQTRGEEGRIVVQGPAVAAGYLGSDFDASDGSGRFEPGGFVTGDLGRLLPADQGGGLVLSGRLVHLLNVAGRKVNPREIERALMEIAGVREAMVLGEPDAARGEAPVACLAAEEGIDARAVLSSLRGRLSDYKLPRRIIFVPALPRGERGKVDTEALRARIAAGGSD